MKANALLRHSSRIKQKITDFLGIFLIINWVILLSIYTFELQYSCEPLIGKSTCSSCVDSETSESFWRHVNIFIQEESLLPCSETPVIIHKTDNTDIPESKISSEGNETDAGTGTEPSIEAKAIIEGSLIGSVVAVAAAVVGAPAVVAVGVGVAIWLTASTLLSSIS